MQMAQNKEEVFRNGAVCALRRKKGRTYKQVDSIDDFTINLVITVIVLFIGLALVRGEND